MNIPLITLVVVVLLVLLVLLLLQTLILNYIIIACNINIILAPLIVLN